MQWDICINCNNTHYANRVRVNLVISTNMNSGSNVANWVSSNLAGDIFSIPTQVQFSCYWSGGLLMEKQSYKICTAQHVVKEGYSNSPLISSIWPYHWRYAPHAERSLMHAEKQLDKAIHIMSGWHADCTHKHTSRILPLTLCRPECCRPEWTVRHWRAPAITVQRSPGPLVGGVQTQPSYWNTSLPAQTEVKVQSSN